MAHKKGHTKREQARRERNFGRVYKEDRDYEYLTGYHGARRNKRTGRIEH